MNKKNIIILGAGAMQIPAIVSAKELGLFVNVLDADSRAEAIPLADRFEHIDIKDAESVRDYALNLQKTQGLCGVFTAGTDFSFSVSLASQACSLPAHSPEAAKNASDKTRMRKCFETHGVASPKFFEASSPWTQGCDLNFPLVVKPVDNMGARGCRMVRTQDELLPALKAAAQNSRSGRVIIEEYMEGPEFSVDALVYNGTLTICGFADRHIFYPPYFIEMGHTMPSCYDARTIRALVEEFARAVHALGLTCGAAKGDIKLTSRGPMIGEVAARLSGGYMSGWTFPYASGLNLTKEALCLAIGKTPSELEKARRPVLPRDSENAPNAGHPFELYDVPCSRVCAERAWISIPGKVASVMSADGPDKLYELRELAPACHIPALESNAKESEGVKNIFFRASSGDEVVFPKNNVQKCGNVIALADTREKAVESALNIVRGIVIRLAPNTAPVAPNAKFERGFPPDAFSDALNAETRGTLDTALESCPPIPRGKPVFPLLPEPLVPFLDSPADWNSRTLRQTLLAFDKIFPDHAELPAREFWYAALRGGLQGILYLADNIK